MCLVECPLDGFQEGVAVALIRESGEVEARIEALFLGRDRRGGHSLVDSASEFVPGVSAVAEGRLRAHEIERDIDLSETDHQGREGRSVPVKLELDRAVLRAAAVLNLNVAALSRPVDQPRQVEAVGPTLLTPPSKGCIDRS